MCSCGSQKAPLTPSLPQPQPQPQPLTRFGRDCDPSFPAPPLLLSFPFPFLSAPAETRSPTGPRAQHQPSLDCVCSLLLPPLPYLLPRLAVSVPRAFPRCSPCRQHGRVKCVTSSPHYLIGIADGGVVSKRGYLKQSIHRGVCCVRCL